MTFSVGVNMGRDVIFNNSKRVIYPHWRKDEIEMDTLPCLREQNEVADTGRYRAKKLSPLLPEVQAGKFD